MMKTLYCNGTILTMENALTAEAVLEEDGLIRAVGSLEELKPLAGDARIRDLEGCTMLPAFIDAHSHFSACANAMLQVPLDEAVTFEEIKERIAAYIKEKQIPKGAWVMAKGYDHNQLEEKDHPRRQVLDEVSPDHPLVLQHRSGHVGVFNSRALELFQITAHTPVPEGGLLEIRDGSPTGYMEENAFLEYLQKVPMPSVKDLLDAYEKAQEQYASYGIATVQEGMLPKALAPLYQGLLKADLLKLDLVGYVDEKDGKELLETFQDYRGGYRKHFRIGGYKIFLDGSPQGLTAWMREPYESRPGYRGYNTLSDEEVYGLCRKAVEGNVQILAHCNGDAACDQYLRAMERIKAQGMDTARIRPVMVHAQLLGKDQIPRLSDLGMIPSFFVGHVYYWGDIHIQNFGMARAAGISPAKSAFQEGLPVTFHQDSPVIAPDMMETIWCAVNRRTKDGILLGQGEQISVLEALAAVTKNAAHQYFEEDKKGSIAPGKYADFVILADNPLIKDPMGLKDISVLETIKEGETIFARA